MRVTMLVLCLLGVAACSMPTNSAVGGGGETICLSAPINDGRAFLARHSEELAAEIVRREVFVIANMEQDVIRTARVMDVCGAGDERISPEAYRQIRDQFASGYTTPNDACVFRAQPTSHSARNLLMEDLLSSGLGGAATFQIDDDYLEVQVGASCDLAEPFIRSYLERRGIDGGRRTPG